MERLKEIFKKLREKAARMDICIYSYQLPGKFLSIILIFLFFLSSSKTTKNRFKIWIHFFISFLIVKFVLSLRFFSHSKKQMKHKIGKHPNNTFVILCNGFHSLLSHVVETTWNTFKNQNTCCTWSIHVF